jgi:hypothetical protein
MIPSLGDASTYGHGDQAREVHHLIVRVEGQSPDTSYLCVDLDAFCLSEIFIPRQGLRGI